MGYKRRIADLFEGHPELEKIYREHIRKINNKYEFGCEEVGCYCGKPYPADECINCNVEDAIKHRSACLFGEILEI